MVLCVCVCVCALMSIQRGAAPMKKQRTTETITAIIDNDDVVVAKQSTKMVDPESNSH